MGFIKNAQPYRSHFFDGSNGADPINYILKLIRHIAPTFDTELLRKVHYDIVDIFEGNTPPFRRNMLPYHTLRHTMMVALAAMRFMHGLFFMGRRVDNETILQGMLCAYFHDIGMLTKTDEPPNPFQHISTHEKRSADFLLDYIAANSLPIELAEEAEIIIGYTRLSSDPKEFPFHSRKAQMLGQVIGASDILSQMGDRYYLELLPALFGELASGRLTPHNGVVELMHETIFFYHDTVFNRLFNTYIDVIDAMRLHFAIYQGIDSNLYLKAANKNIDYLQTILPPSSSTEYPKHLLRRQVPILIGS